MAEVEKVVLADGFSWTEPDPVNGPNAHRTRFAFKGQTVKVDESTLNDDQKAALGSEEELTAREVVDAADEASIATDENLGAMRTEEVLAYVTQHPEEARRIIDLEKIRSRPRRAILELEDHQGEQTGG